MNDTLHSIQSRKPPNTAGRASDPWRRAIVVAAGVAVVALLIALLAPAFDGGGGRSSQPGGGLSGDQGGSGTRVESGQGADGYARWPLPGVDSLLMIPAEGRDGAVWFGEMESRTLALRHVAGPRTLFFPLPATAHAHTNGIAVDTENIVWMAQDGVHAITRFDPELRRTTVYQTPTARSSPFGVAVDGDGTVWFTETAAHKIGRFDPATEQFTEYPLPGGARGPYWLAVAEEGRIWFTTLSSPAIGVLDPADGQITIHRVPGLSDADGTTGIDIAADGTVWFGVRGGRIGRLDPTAGEIRTFRLPSDNAYGVAADDHGRVWVASTHDAVFAFEPWTEQACAVRTGDGAWWVTVDTEGAVWIAESVRGANAIGRISPERAAAPCP